MNACGHHHVGHIGILGVDKKAKSSTRFPWAVMLDIPAEGAQTRANRRSIGRPGEVCDVIEKILHMYIAQRFDGESFLAFFNRIGIDPFKESIYASAA